MKNLIYIFILTISVIFSACHRSHIGQFLYIEDDGTVHTNNHCEMLTNKNKSDNKSNGVHYVSVEDIKKGNVDIDEDKLKFCSACCDDATFKSLKKYIDDGIDYQDAHPLDSVLDTEYSGN